MNKGKAIKRQKQGPVAQFTRLSAAIEDLCEHELEMRKAGCWASWDLPEPHVQKLEERQDRAEQLLDAIGIPELAEVSRNLWWAAGFWVGDFFEERKRLAYLKEIRARQSELLARAAP